VLKESAEESARIGNHHVAALLLSLRGLHDEALSEAVASVNVNDEGSSATDIVDGEIAAALAFCHVQAITSRPPFLGTSEAADILLTARLKAAASLAAEGLPSMALALYLQVLDKKGMADGANNGSTGRNLFGDALSLLEVALKVRSTMFLRAWKLSVSENKTALERITEDLALLGGSALGWEKTWDCALSGALKLYLAGELDSAMALGIAGVELSTGDIAARFVAIVQFLAVGSTCQALESCEDALFHHREERSRKAETSTTLSMYNRVSAVLAMSRGKFRSLERCNVALDSLYQGKLLLKVCQSYKEGDWAASWAASAKMLQNSGAARESTSDSDPQDDTVGAEEDLANSAEELRELASSPAVRPGSRGIRAGSIRSSICNFDFIQGLSSPRESRRRFSVDEMDSESESLTRERHALLNYALGAAVIAATTSSMASFAESSGDHIFREVLASPKRKFNNPVGRATHRLEDTAIDGLHGWLPFPRFGASQSRHIRRATNDCAYNRLWKVLCTVGEFAPLMAEAATVVAAAEAQVEEEKQRPSRGRSKPKVLVDDSYPIRFGQGSTGPRSGQGRHVVVHHDNGELIRSIAVSSSDPPIIVVASPRGIRELLPQSYVHAKERGNRAQSFELAVKQGRRMNLAALEDRIPQAIGLSDDEALDEVSLSNPVVEEGQATESTSLWRSRAEATAVAAHPSKRRYASGGQDGKVTLWAIDEDQALLELPRGPGRVAALRYSAYGQSLLSVHVSGYLMAWSNPDFLSARSRDGVKIDGFGNRRASDAVFLDEKNVIAAVGDPGGVSSAGAHAVGHSLRVFDMREPSHAERATWTCRVHGGIEARCLSMLEDRVRIVTGGVDGTLSIVDTRAQGCIAEQLPAHAEEIVSMCLESPRGRALATGCHGGVIKLWDSRTLLNLDTIADSHAPTRHFWAGSGFGGIVGTHGVKSLHLTDRALISCGGDGAVKIWGPGWGSFDHTVL